jgi:hypothetical protein
MTEREQNNGTIAWHYEGLRRFHNRVWQRAEGKGMV